MHSELDPAELLAHHPLIVYRLVSARYANLSGAGAALYPGRWNMQGEAAIYTSLHPSTAILEKLAHMPRRAIPTNLALMTIAIAGNWIQQGSFLLEPDSSAIMVFHRSAARAAEQFASAPGMFGLGTDPMAVAVPSVLSPAWNLVLFPSARGFWQHVSVATIQRFEFDARFFPTETATQ